MKNVYKKRLNGFTIVELLVVIVVIGVLAAVSVVSYVGVQEKAKRSILESDLAQIIKQLKIYSSINEDLPTNLSSLNNGSGINLSQGAVVNYSYNNDVNPKEYCVDVSKNNLSYRIVSNSEPEEGDCFNYGLIAYLDAGNTDSYPGSGTVWTDLSGNGADGSLNNITYSSSDGGSLVFNGSTSYVSSTISQNYVDTFVIFKPDFTAVNGAGLAGLIATGLSTDLSMRFSSVDGSGTWNINNPGNANDWARSPNSTIYRVNGTNASQLNLGWNALSAYRTNNSAFPNNFTYFIGSGYPSRYYKGNVAVVMLFDRRLSADDHQRYFNYFRSRYGL